MNGTGNNDEKMWYRVMLLPVVVMVCRVATRFQHWSHHRSVIGGPQIAFMMAF